jgi:hypothetical protein
MEALGALAEYGIYWSPSPSRLGGAISGGTGCLVGPSSVWGLGKAYEATVRCLLWNAKYTS